MFGTYIFGTLSQQEKVSKLKSLTAVRALINKLKPLFDSQVIKHQAPIQ